MAFKQYETPDRDVADQPWIEEWIMEQESAALSFARPVKHVHKVRSGKGYLLQCDVFNVFVFNRSHHAVTLRHYFDKTADMAYAPSLMVLPLVGKSPPILLGEEEDRAVTILLTGEEAWDINPVFQESPLSGKRTVATLADVTPTTPPDSTTSPVPESNGKRSRKSTKIVHQHDLP